MSNSSVNTPCVGVYDPQIDIMRKREYVITKGAQKNSWQPYTSQSTGSNSFSFNVVPPSRLTYLSRNMYVKATVTCTFTTTAPIAADSAVAVPSAGANLGQYSRFSLVQPGFDAPRSFPLSKCINSASVQLGNVNLSMQTGDCIDPLVRIMNFEDFNNDQCPSTPDTLTRYEYGSGQIERVGGTAVIIDKGVSYGNNVLGNNSLFLGSGLPPRGVYNINVATPTLVGGAPIDPTVGGNITQTVSFDVYEPVFLSPFCVNSIHNALIGLQSVNLTYNFSPTCQLVWSGTTKQQVVLVTGVLSALPISMAVSFKNPQLWCNFLSPPTTQSIPPQINWNYDEVVSFVTGNGVVPSAQVDVANTVTSTNLQLKVIPQRIIVGLRRPTALKSYTDPDSYFKINSCAITFANATGILSTCQSEELYNISKKNGLNYDYKSWAGYYDSGTVKMNNDARGIGSLLILNPSEDFGMPENLSAGVMGTYNFNISVNFTPLDKTNYAVANTNYELFVIVVNDGEFSVDVAGSGATSSRIGLITEADCLSATIDYNVNYDELKGNGWLSSIKHFAKKALPLIKDVAPHAIEIFNKAKSHLEDSGSALIGSGQGKGLGRGGRLSKLNSLKNRLA